MLRSPAHITIEDLTPYRSFCFYENICFKNKRETSPIETQSLPSGEAKKISIKEWMNCPLSK